MNERFKITNIPFPGWKEPKPMTKKNIEEIIEAFKNNPEMFKKDRPRWN
jgi:2,4-dienoyl-CoA reductase-like NADH-dependent reductase (Old Yellow Enzyme family)